MIEQKCVVRNFSHAIHLMPKRIQSHASPEKACIVNLISIIENDPDNFLRGSWLRNLTLCTWKVRF